MRGQASSSQASRSQGTAPDELPALRDDSWNEDEPVSGVRIDASPGKPDFFDASPGTSRTASSPWLVIVIDEFSCARRQDVRTAASAFRHVTLETQLRGIFRLHTHGIF